MRLRSALPFAACAATCLAVASVASGQDVTASTTQPVVDAVAAPAAALVNPAIDSGSTAWMLVSSALVLLMMPGLALFYGGMARAKNVLNTFLNVMVCCGVIGVLWVVVGYSLVFPVIDNADGTNKALIHLGQNDYNGTKATVSIIGFDKNLVGLRAFGTADLADPAKSTWNSILTSGDTVGAKPTGVPELVFAMFQGMFAIITPALIVGSVVERVRFGPLLLFLSIWSLLIYCPVAHMVWNVNGFLFQKGVLDFAGGTVVHVLAGVSALALTIVVGPRKGFGTKPMPPHSLGYTLIGAGLLWFGWFGFNAGSAIGISGAELPTAGGVAALAFANTQIAAAAAALSWMLVEWIKDGKPTILGFASGMVAGLVVITPCAGHVAPHSALFPRPARRRRLLLRLPAQEGLQIRRFTRRVRRPRHRRHARRDPRRLLRRPPRRRRHGTGRQATARPGDRDPARLRRLARHRLRDQAHDRPARHRGPGRGRPRHHDPRGIGLQPLGRDLIRRAMSRSNEPTGSAGPIPSSFQKRVRRTSVSG